MRGAKEEEKLLSPMFPRLHVNDTEKGGPRAPPRNKMALYEQFSIPSQRFGSGSPSMLPLPPQNASNLVPSVSSSHGGGYERNVFIPSGNSSVPSHMDEKLFSYTSGGVKSSTMLARPERKAVNSTNDQSKIGTQPLSSSAKCNSFQSHNFSNFKNFSWKKHGNENDIRVTNSFQSGAALHCSKSHRGKGHENQPCFNLSMSVQFQNALEKQEKGMGMIDLKAREYTRNQTEEAVKLPQASQDPVERSASVRSIKDKTSLDSPSNPPGKVKSTETLKRAHPFSNQEYRNSSVDLLKCLHATNMLLNQDLGTTQDKTVFRDNRLPESTGFIIKESVSKVRSESYSRPLLGNDDRSSSFRENSRKLHEDNKRRSLEVGDLERHDDVLETISALDITPDDVVGVIGEKQFLTARKAISNQQRVFAGQVFELHRLIKVQKLIAGQPHILLEDNVYMVNASLKVSPIKKLLSKRVTEQPPVIVKPQHHSQKPLSITEIADWNVVEKLPLPSANNEPSKVLLNPQPNCSSHSGNMPCSPVATNGKLSPWCFPPPGNQWLVPVMSPSEGLVYKPYTGSSMPGFMAPIFGNCGPVSLTPGGGDIFNAAYGVPASHQQGIGILPGTTPLGQTYFPPYGMPVMNPSISGSGVEQMSSFTFPHQQSSCNMPSQTSQVISYCVGKLQASKEGEVQGSTASSPCERPAGDALPLFPTEPTVQASDSDAEANKNHQTHVIKVVPHNPRSATESAARIFQSIQEERKQYD